jgi:hypothetical protein
MNADPKRWLSEGAGGELERDLLASISDVRPPAHAKDQAWHGIAAAVTAGAGAVAASIAPSAAAAASTAAAATTKVGSAVAASALITKAVWTVAAGSIAVGGYFVAREAWPTSPEPRQPERAAEVAAPSEPPKNVAAPRAVEPEAAPIEASEPQVRRAAPRPKRRDPLTEESALLTRARAALRTGDAAGAERMLQRMGTEFPGGVLEQERQVLSIEVLAARGDTAAAKARARAFAQAHPTSPHTARLRSLLDTP